MKKILYGTAYSFKEIKNSKIFYSFLIFALILISGSYFVSQTSFINQGRIMVDFSIFAISIFNIFIGIFIGASVVYDDIEKKSVFLTITRPLKRTEYLIGRFLGLASAIIFSTIVMMLIFYAVLLIMHKFIVPVGYSAGNVKGKFILYSLPQPLIIQALFIITESIFIAAAALLFSLITSKALASIFAILVFFHRQHFRQDERFNNAGEKDYKRENSNSSSGKPYLGGDSSFYLYRPAQLFHIQYKFRSRI